MRGAIRLERLRPEPFRFSQAQGGEFLVDREFPMCCRCSTRKSYTPMSQLLISILLIVGMIGQLQAEPAPVSEDIELTPWIGVWQCFGPVTSNKSPGKWRPWFEPRSQPIELDGCARIPERILVDGQTLVSRPFHIEIEEINFQQLWHVNSGQGIVYLFRIENAERAGLQPVVCEAEGWV